MDTTMQDRLNRIKNRTTLYEVVATDGDRTVLVVYCGKTKTRFWRAVAENNSARGKGLAELAGTDHMILDKTAGSSTIGTLGKWTIKFTGRTQRDAIIEDKKYPYITDVSAK